MHISTIFSSVIGGLKILIVDGWGVEKSIEDCDMGGAGGKQIRIIQAI